MKTLNFSLLLLLAFAPSSLLAKPHPTKSAAKKAVDEKDAEKYLNDVVSYEGTTKVPVLAQQAILIDYNTNKVLLEKNADQRMVPSSMTKMMTSYLVTDRLKKGELKPETTFPVSERAWKIQGSKTFVPLRDKDGNPVSIKVIDLLRGIIVQSGNDACIVAAEGISGGSEPQFAMEMNDKAKALGMTGTQFKNSSGWPDENHYSTARDLAKLSSAVVRDHPEYYDLYKEKDFTFNGIKQGNRNPLLYDNLGCDGIKTGHTEDGGYGVAASCLDGQQRYILVINGLSSMQARADEARKLINWAKENFVNKVVVKKGEVINKAVPLTMGKRNTVAVIAQNDVSLLVLRSEQNKIEKKVELSDSLFAPIKMGDPVGKIIVSSPNNKREGTVVSGENVEKIGYVGRMLRFIGFDV